MRKSKVKKSSCPVPLIPAIPIWQQSPFKQQAEFDCCVSLVSGVLNA
jgi:hypothetical protein